MPETRFFDVRGASRDEFDPFASGSYEDYELTASGLLGQLRQTDIQRVRVMDAYLTGVLDLRAVDGTLDLAFERCRFEYPPDVRLAKLIGLRFSRCWLPGLKARSLRTRDDLRMTRCVVQFEPDDVEIEETTTGHDRERGMPSAAVNLTDAVIDGSVVLTRTVINHPRGKAIQADRARITGALLAYRMVVNGEVRIPGLRTGGNVNFSGATLNNPDGFALNGNGLHIGGSLLCEVDNYGPARERKRFSANGILYFPSATVDSDIMLREARLMVNQHGPIAVAAWKSNDPYLDPRPALVADRLKVDGNLELSDGLQATGTLRMVNARIGGSLRLAGAEVQVARGDRTPSYDRALHLDGSEIGGDIVATSLRVPAGQIRLADVTVGGNVLAWNTMFLHPGRDVLSARRTRIAGNLHLTDATVQGTLQLQGVEVGGSLNLYGTELTEPDVRGSSSFSLDVRTARIGHDLVLTEAKHRSFRATGGVNLDGAQVARRVDLRGAVLGSLPLHGIALDASGAAAREFLLTPDVPPKGRLVLRRAHCGTFEDNLAFWHATGGVELEDFRYDQLSAGDTLDLRPPGQRIALLRLAMGGYRPGPYDQLAATLRAAGDEDQASTVLLKKQQFGYSALAQRFKTFGFMVVFWSWLQRVISGYGFRPGRFVGWLLVVLAAAVTLLGTDIVTSAGTSGRGWAVFGLVVVACIVLLGGVTGVARRHEAQLTYLVLRLPSATSPVAAAPVERTAPAVPRFSGWASPPSADTTISVDTYLDTDDLRVVRTALAAVDEFVLELGYSPVSNVDIQLGSVFRRAKASVRKTLKSEELRNRLIKAERALELKVLDVQQAEVDLKQADAVSRLIGSLQTVPQACLRVGSILLVKYTDGDNPVMLTRTLTQLEMRALDRYPEIQNRPRDALAALGTAILSMDDDMDSESARKAIES